TCSVPAIPPAWAEQVAAGGLILADLKPATHAGNLVLLRRHPDRLEGRFLPNWAGFMPLRHTDTAPDYPPDLVDPASITQVTVTALDPRPWTNLVPGFLAHADLPCGVTFGVHGVGPDGPEWVVLSSPDGSNAAIGIHPRADGYRPVRQTGPWRLWD